MGSLNDAMVRAEKLGRRAADKRLGARRWPAAMMETGPTRSAGATGRLALDAFREFGEPGMRAVMTGYQAGYRSGPTLDLETAEEEAA